MSNFKTDLKNYIQKNYWNNPWFIQDELKELFEEPLIQEPENYFIRPIFINDSDGKQRIKLEILVLNTNSILDIGIHENGYDIGYSNLKAISIINQNSRRVKEKKVFDITIYLNNNATYHYNSLNQSEFKRLSEVINEIKRKLDNVA